MQSKTDISLIFPPQWSPFQPALSLPSLYAWLINNGFSAKCHDLNIEFYWWLLSDECASILLSDLNKSDISLEKRHTYQTIFSNSEAVRSDIKCLRTANPDNDIDLLTRHFVFSKTIDVYLRALSDIQESFEITAYEFKISQDYLNTHNIEKFINAPPNAIKSFINSEANKLIFNRQVPTFGISCIGQEQLVFTLLIGKRIKELTSSCVVIGGTVFPRIFDRGTLPKSWFGKYFDLIIINEGEKPLQDLLSRTRRNWKEYSDIDGIVYYDPVLDTIRSTKPACPLDPAEIPIPNFDEMPLLRYLSSDITLPLLSSRGCYWGKCSFCHHGMVYGERYSTYSVDKISTTLQYYSERYGVSSFAFNDEAIPPKLMRKMGESFPDSSESGWSFTGLIKFEKYFTRSDFNNAAQIGFKSLFVGLESASEKVLRLMKKSNSKEIMIRNLSDANRAGILIHCFVFFGFPGESESDAQETFDFLLEHNDIIGSVGCGTFSLEHTAPIFHDPNSHNVSILLDENNGLDIYYKYNVHRGISQERAREWSSRLNNAIFNNAKYYSTNWIPREHQLTILKQYDIPGLVSWGEETIKCRNTPQHINICKLLLFNKDEKSILLVNRLTRKSLIVKGNMAKALTLMISKDINITELREFSESLFYSISSSEHTLPEFARSTKVI